MAFAPSKYQQDVFDWIDSQISRNRTQTANLVVKAGPGSGKTTTLEQAAHRLPSTMRKNALFVAFNKHIAEELGRRLPPGMKAKTLHSAGMGSVIRWVEKNHPGWSPNFDRWIDSGWHRKLAQDWLMEHRDKLQLSDEEWRDTLEAIETLIDVCQLTVTDCRDTEQIWKLIEWYGLNDVAMHAEVAISALPSIFSRIVSEAYKTISFNEMIWLPVSQKLWIKQYDVVMADESQDFNRCQRWLVKKMTARNGITVWVGDPNQAIYGFAYASTRSIEEIINETKADTLPLSICYRCPSTHVALANEIIDAGIEARPGAPEGEVTHILDFQVADQIERGDLVVCRVNAPLIPLCFELIRRKVGAKVKGTDIGRNLISLVEKIEKQRDDGINWQSPRESLREWADEETKLLSQRISDKIAAEMAICNLLDKIETLIAIWEGNQPSTTAAMIQEIKALFADHDAIVWLSTIHKAKGLEAQNVYILAPSKMPHPMAQRPWEREQENNMKYIAVTRAKSRLTYVWSPGEPGCPPIPTETKPESTEPEATEPLTTEEVIKRIERGYRILIPARAA